MKTLASLDLLNAWEQGLGRGVAERALILLRLAAGEQTEKDPARWPIGQRDACLLELRESVFGQQVDGVASCPECGVQQEFRMPVGQLKVAPPDSGTAMALVSGDYQVNFRLPDSLDLCELEAVADMENDLSLRLLQSCVTNATVADHPVAAVDLPGDVVQQISERMAQADPQADISLSLECPDCAHRWSEPFDIASFLWTELSAWASRTLFDVHQLAAAYGWSEAESLSMSPRRRSFYLEMIAG